MVKQEDIAEAFDREAIILRENNRVVSLRSSYGGSQTALVLLPTNQANNIISKGLRRSSKVSCRVREK